MYAGREIEIEREVERKRKIERETERERETKFSLQLVDETGGETVNPSYDFAKAATDRVHKLGLETGRGALSCDRPLPSATIFRLGTVFFSHEYSEVYLGHSRVLNAQAAEYRDYIPAPCIIANRLCNSEMINKSDA